MKIPTFEEATKALIEKRGTPLDRFVAYWEPKHEDEKFREMLCGLLLYVIDESANRERLSARPDPTVNPLHYFWDEVSRTYVKRK